jgi:CBS-domain-containing membrane protein
MVEGQEAVMRISDTIGLVLKSKEKNRVLSIEPDQTVYEALEKMAEYDVGALLVLSNRHLVGILSERDYARKGILIGQPGFFRQSPTHCGRMHDDYDPTPFSPSSGAAG